MRPDVTLISPYPRAGERHGGSSGVASYTANLAHALAAAGADVTVVAPRERLEPEVRRDGPVRVERRFGRGPAALPAAVGAACATGAPTVHLQHETFLYGGAASVPGLVAGLGRLRGRPGASVVTMHHVVAPGAVDGAFTRLHRVRAPAAAARAGLAVVREAVRSLADAVVVHEPAFAEAVRGARVVPHGVEAASTVDRAAARAALGVGDGRLCVLCFGFLAPYKGLEAALEAGRLARDRVQVVVAGGEHPRLSAAGDGYAERLRRQHRDHARFTGRVPADEVDAWFAAADLALFPYPRPVSSSGALALALAHGTPVLLSPELAACAGAPAELVAPRSPVGLAAALDALAAEPARLAALGLAGGELARGRRWPAVARRHLELYEEVAA